MFAEQSFNKPIYSDDDIIALWKIFYEEKSPPGTAQAFKEINSLLVRYAVRLGITQTQAEDAIQDRLLNIFTKRDLSGTPSEQRSFVYRTIRNRCTDYRRHKKTLSLDDFYSLEFKSDDYARIETEMDILNALKKLPNKHKDSIILAYIEDLSDEECAKIFGITLQAFKSQLFRAKGKLKKTNGIPDRKL